MTGVLSTTGPVTLKKSLDADDQYAFLATELNTNIDNINAAFNATTGHDHDGTDSKAFAWADFTPTLTNGSGQEYTGVTINRARYCKIGKTVHIQVMITFTAAYDTGTTPAATGIYLNPNNATLNALAIHLLLGTFAYNSPTGWYTGHVISNLVSNFLGIRDAVGNFIGDPSSYISVGDMLRYNLTYEIA